MIHPTAIISKKSQIGDNVNIAAFSIINDGVILEDGCDIGSYCELGINTPLAKSNQLLIGKNSVIRSHSKIYIGSDFSKGIMTGHNVTIRENTCAGFDFRIGTNSDLLGDCKIGNYTRLHSNVFIGKKAIIGSFVWLFPCVILTDDPHPPSNYVLGVTIEDYSVIAARSIILPGIKIGRHSLVAAGSMVNRNVEPQSLVGGNPAKKIGELKNIKLRDQPEVSAYPWTRHFHRGYPEEIINKWKI